MRLATQLLSIICSLCRQTAADGRQRTDGRRQPQTRDLNLRVASLYRACSSRASNNERSKLITVPDIADESEAWSSHIDGDRQWKHATVQCRQ